MFVHVWLKGHRNTIALGTAISLLDYTKLKSEQCDVQSCAYQFGQPIFQDSEETIHSAEINDT